MWLPPHVKTALCSPAVPPLVVPYRASTYTRSRHRAVAAMIEIVFPGSYPLSNLPTH